MKKKCRVYKKTGNTPKHLQKGGPAMTQDSQQDPVYEQRNANFLNFLKTTSQDAVAKQQLDQQKKMTRGYAEDGQEQKDKKDGTYIPEYLDKGNITRPGAKMNDYGYLDNSNMNAFIGDYQNSRPDWGGSFFGLLGAANKTKKNMFKMELEDGQTQQNFFKDPTDIDYDQTSLDKLDFTGYKKAGKRGKDRILSYTAEGTSKYIPGQRQKAWDASKGILDVAKKEGDFNPTPGSQYGGGIYKAQDGISDALLRPIGYQQDVNNSLSNFVGEENYNNALNSVDNIAKDLNIPIQLNQPWNEALENTGNYLYDKASDFTNWLGFQDGGQPSPEEMAMMQAQQAQAPQQPQEQQTDEIIGQVQQALEGGAQPQEVMMQLLQSGMPPESVAQVFIQLGMPQEQVVQAIEQVMAQGQEQAQGPQPSEEEMMAMQQQQQMGAPAPPMMQTGGQDSYSIYDGQLQKAQYGDEYGDEYGQGTNRDGNNMYGSRDYSNNPMNQMNTAHGYMDFLKNINTPKEENDDRQVTEDGEIYLKKQGRFKQAWNDNANFGRNTNNLMQMATNIGNLGENKQKKLDAKERMSNVHRRFAVGPQDRGDYASNAFGFGDNLKMDQKTRMGYDTKVAQGGMQVNDEMELTEEQINQLISQGYQLEYLD
jgi:hypothetical protein